MEAPGTPAARTVSMGGAEGEAYKNYLSDESRMPGGNADTVAFVHSEVQLVELLRECSDRQRPVTVSGGRTGIVGGAVPQQGLVLSMEHMNRVESVRWNPSENTWCLRVGAGLSIQRLGEMLEPGRFPEAPSEIRGLLRDDWNRFRGECHEWFYAPDPTEKTALVGGTVATNASGSRSLKYGSTRNHITGLRVALMDGTLLDLVRDQAVSDGSEPFLLECRDGVRSIPVPAYAWPRVKNSAGYYSRVPLDLVDVFIGSEGTLGVVSEVEIRLARKPEAVFGVLAFFPAESQAIRFVKAVKPYEPSVLEYFDAASLHLIRDGAMHDALGPLSTFRSLPDSSNAAMYTEVMCREQDMDRSMINLERLLKESGASADSAWTAPDAHELLKMEHFRHAVPELVNTWIGIRQKDHPSIHKIGTDFTVPDTTFERMLCYYRTVLDAAGLEYLVFGHIGESHVHVNILPGDEEGCVKAKETVMDLAKKAVELGGSLSGEHGIGKLKRHFIPLMFSEYAINSMKNIKLSLDPKELLGKGILF